MKAIVKGLNFCSNYAWQLPVVTVELDGELSGLMEFDVGDEVEVTQSERDFFRRRDDFDHCIEAAKSGDKKAIDALPYIVDRMMEESK